MNSVRTLSANSMGTMKTTFREPILTFDVEDDVTSPSSQVMLLRVSPSQETSLKLLQRALMIP